MLPTPSNDRSRTPTFVRFAALAVALAAMFGLVQAAAPGMVGGDDGYYHVKLAALMRYDLTPEFTWLPLTILGPDAFVDHHWLFHVLLIPFTGMDLVIAGQAAAVVFATAALLAGGWLMRAQGVPAPELWTLLMFGSGAGFVYRMSMPRAQSLSLLMLFLTVHLLLTRRHRGLALLGMVYVWLYDAFPLILVVAAAYAVSVWMLERRFAWRPVAWAVGGVAVGLIANPYFPRNFVFVYHHLAAKLAPLNVPVGSEWYPYDTHQLVQNAGPALIALMLGAVALGWRRERLDVPSLFAFVLCTVFAALLFSSRRFVEYFPPFGVLFLALAARPLLAHRRLPTSQVSAALAAGIALAALTVVQARNAVSDDRPAGDLAGAALWLSDNSPPASMVFQTDWDDFPRLYFYNSHNTYTIGLDPTFLQRQDEGLYFLWVDLTHGRGLDLSGSIRKHFGARYVISDLRHASFLERAAEDPQLIEVFRDDSGVVFEVLD